MPNGESLLPIYDQLLRRLTQPSGPPTVPLLGNMLQMPTTKIFFQYAYFEDCITC